MTNSAVPPEVDAKYKSWKFWAFLWNTVHYTLGVVASVFTALIAAHTKHPFLAGNTAVTIAVSAAGISFLSTGLNAQKKGAGFQAAYRILERAMSKYTLADNDPGQDFLAEAEVKGIDVLDSAG